MAKSRLLLAAQTLATLALCVGASMAHATYWNLFNLEGESSLGARYVTYSTLTDMLGDVNHLGVFAPDGQGSGQFAANVIGSGSDVRRANPQPIPEPSSMLLMGLGLAALAASGRWQRRTAYGRSDLKLSRPIAARSSSSRV